MIQFIGRWFGLVGVTQEEKANLRKDSERAVLRAGLRFEAGIKKSLTGPRTGHWYGSHQASAPGESPASDSGDLKKSITHSMPIWDDERVYVEVGTSLWYAATLEFGGMTAFGRILPRPYIEKTFVLMQEELESILAEAIEGDPTSITTFEGE